MPELPEVEFAARLLRTWLVGHTIRRAEAFDGTPLRGLTATEFIEGVVGRRITGVRRRGKQLFIDLAASGRETPATGSSPRTPLDGTVLLAHLGMTGKFLRRQPGDEVRRGTRAQLWLDDGARVDFVDPRRFGRLRLLPAGAVDTDPEIAKLGPDALTLDTPGVLYGRLRGVRRPVKVALMDQSLVAGVGNIYASEALFRAGLSPRRRADRVGRGTADRLGRALVAVMRESLARELDEEIRYLQDAESENPFDVYGREGAPCPRCGAPIRRAVQQGRSTYWCAVCQPR